MSGGVVQSGGSASRVADWPFAEVLDVVFSGLGVVLSVLMLLALITALIGRFFVYRETRKQADRAAASGAATGPTSREETELRLIAVLSAAAFEVLGQPARVVKIRRIEPGMADWSLQGRTEIHSSHKLR